MQEALKFLKAPESILSWHGSESGTCQVSPKCLQRLHDDALRCVLADRCDSPYNSVSQRMAGVVYEKRLEETLRRENVLFLTEADMRSRGCEKTPDILLQVWILLP